VDSGVSTIRWEVTSHTPEERLSNGISTPVCSPTMGGGGWCADYYHKMGLESSLDIKLKDILLKINPKPVVKITAGGTCKLSVEGLPRLNRARHAGQTLPLGFCGSSFSFCSILFGFGYSLSRLGSA
jgi:hypothetical protein